MVASTTIGIRARQRALDPEKKSHADFGFGSLEMSIGSCGGTQRVSEQYSWLNPASRNNGYALLTIEYWAKFNEKARGCWI
jgi:hypothetical protein